MVRNGTDKSVFVGQLFEDIAVHMFGGEITDRGPLVGNARQVGKIDITDISRKRLIEVKSGNDKDRFILLERQFHKLRNLLKGNYGQLNLFLNDFELYYAFFSYKNSTKLYEFENHEILNNKLRNSIDSVMILSFDIIEKMFEFYKVRRNTRWLDHIMFQRKDINDFLNNTENALVSFGLDPADYIIQRSYLHNETVNRFRGISVVNNNYISGEFFDKYLS